MSSDLCEGISALQLLDTDLISEKNYASKEDLAEVQFVLREYPRLTVKLRYTDTTEIGDLDELIDKDSRVLILVVNSQTAVQVIFDYLVRMHESFLNPDFFELFESKMKKEKKICPLPPSSGVFERSALGMWQTYLAQLGVALPSLANLDRIKAEEELLARTIINQLTTVFNRTNYNELIEHDTIQLIHIILDRVQDRMTTIILAYIFREYHNMFLDNIEDYEHSDYEKMMNLLFSWLWTKLFRINYYIRIDGKEISARDTTFFQKSKKTPKETLTDQDIARFEIVPLKRGVVKFRNALHYAAHLDFFAERMYSLDSAVDEMEYLVTYYFPHMIADDGIHIILSNTVSPWRNQTFICPSVDFNDPLRRYTLATLQKRPFEKGEILAMFEKKELETMDFD